MPKGRSAEHTATLERLEKGKTEVLESVRASVDIEYTPPAKETIATFYDLMRQAYRTMAMPDNPDFLHRLQAMAGGGQLEFFLWQSLWHDDSGEALVPEVRVEISEPNDSSLTHVCVGKYEQDLDQGLPGQYAKEANQEGPYAVDDNQLSAVNALMQEALDSGSFRYMVAKEDSIFR